MNDFYNVEQAATKTGFSERYIRERLNDGSLKGYKTGRKWFITPC
jgi:excisionase family DNA binding protein